MEKTPCIITIKPWDEKKPVNVETGDVSFYEVINLLEGVQKVLAQELVRAAEKAVGPDPKKQEEWMDKMLKKYDRG